MTLDRTTIKYKQSLNIINLLPGALQYPWDIVISSIATSPWKPFPRTPSNTIYNIYLFINIYLQHTYHVVAYQIYK